MNTESMQYDPRTKQRIKDALYEHLYGPVKCHFEKRLDTIIMRNTISCRLTHKSFTYKGEIYNIDNSAPPKRLNRLSPELQPLMDEYLRDLRELDRNEIPQIIGFINQVLNSSNDLHDYLRILPDSVHGPIQELINNCPCRASTLEESKVQEMIANNQKTINMMKSRMVTNLII